MTSGSSEIERIEGSRLREFTHLTRGAPTGGQARGRILRIVCLALSLSLAGCASVASRVRSLNRAGDFDAAIALGESWLEDEQRAKEEEAEASKVRTALAAAHFEKLKRNPSYDGWQNYRKRFDAFEGADAHREEASVLEAEAFYAERVRDSGSVPAHQEFRSQYPNSPLVSQVRRQEATLALQALERSGSVHAYRKYQNEYDGWDEVKDLIEVVRVKELNAAMIVAASQGTAAAWRGVREDYEEWKEAADALPKIRKKEVGLAFAEARESTAATAWTDFIRMYDGWSEAETELHFARERGAELMLERIRKTGSRDELRTFIREYKDPTWQDRALHVEAELAFRPISQRIDEHEVPSDEEVEMFLNSFAGAEYLTKVSQGREAKLWSLASRGYHPAFMRLYRNLFPGTKRAEQIWKREVNLAWERAAKADSRESWIKFLHDYSSSEEAEAAEYRLYVAQQLETLNSEYPRAEISRIDRINKSTFDVYLNVRDCYGFRVAGLTEGAFDVYADDRPAVIEDFWGLERDRPIDFAFAVDVSGSMSTEIYAIESAILHFTEVLRFRGRDARLSIITFSDTVETALDLTSNATRFKEKISEVKENLFGGGLEDGIEALTRALRLRFGSASDRAVIMLTDEELQGATTRAGYDKLLREMVNKRLHPFFLVPAEVEPIFQIVAAATGGATILVPQDGIDPAPYMEGLEEIADRLSKEYKLRVFAPKRSANPRIQVGVRHMHHWSPTGRMEEVEILRLFGDGSQQGHGGNDDCRALYVAAKTGVWRTEDCGETWEEQAFDRAVNEVREAHTEEQFALLRTNVGDLLLDHNVSGHRFVDLAEYEAGMIRSDLNGHLWVTGKKDGFWHLLRLDAYDDEFIHVSSWPSDRSTGGPWLLVSGEKRDVCVVTSQQERHCTTDDGLRWGKDKVKGVSQSDFSRGGEVTALAGRPGVFLYSRANGGVIRSLNYGRSWTKTLAPTGTVSRLANVGGLYPVVCATRPGGLLCSEDGGRDWFPALRQGGGGTDGLLAGAGNFLFLLEDQILYRLDRVLNREIPSSAVYFATGDPKPLPAMYPFLQEIARLLGANPQMYLNVEGHADVRGSEKRNEVLSRNRAENVRRVLISQGVRPEQVHVAYYGESRPIRKGTNKKSLARNRRVELIMLRKAPSAGWGASNCVN